MKKEYTIHEPLEPGLKKLTEKATLKNQDEVFEIKEISIRLSAGCSYPEKILIGPVEPDC